MISTQAGHKSSSSTLNPFSSRKRPRSVSPANTSDESLPPPSSSPSSPSSLTNSTTSNAVESQPAQRLDQNDFSVKEKQNQTATKPQANKKSTSSQNADENQRKRCKKILSKRKTKKSDHSKLKTSLGLGVRPFRIRPGCIVVVRYRPTDKQSVVKILSSPSENTEGKKGASERLQMYSLGKKRTRDQTISPYNTTELWLDPQQGRDEGYALIGKQVCLLVSSHQGDKERKSKKSKKSSGSSRVIHGEIVAVETKDYDSTICGIRAHVLIENGEIGDHLFLNSYKVDDNNTSMDEKEMKRRQSENIFRGENNSIFSITLGNPHAKYEEKQKRGNDSSTLFVDRWKIKKRIPINSGIDREIMSPNNHVGDENDKSNRQRMNWLWIAERHHPWSRSNIPIDSSLIDPILLGKVVDTNFSEHTVTLQKLYLPEHTQQGRLSHHARNEVFHDVADNILCASGKGIYEDSALSQSNSNCTLYELPDTDVLVISSKCKKIKYGEEIAPNYMIARSGYNLEQDIYYPTYKDSDDTGIDNCIVDRQHEVCYRCRRVEKVDKMRHCTFETCYGMSSTFGAQPRKTWCFDCCQFLCDKGVFKNKLNNWCCPCCMGVCDCETDMPCRAAMKGQKSFEDTLKSNLRKISETISSLEQNNLANVEKYNAQPEEPCAICLRQCARSTTKCTMCARFAHKECFKWENELYWNRIGKKAATETSVDVKSLTKTEVKKLSKKLTEKLNKKKGKQLKKKQCFKCLFQDNSSCQYESKTSIHEPPRKLLNHTAKLLETLPPIDFVLPFNFVSEVPEIKKDPYIKDSKIESVAEVNAAEVVLSNINTSEIHCKQLKKRAVTSPKRKMIEPTKSVKDDEGILNVKPKTSEDVKIEDEIEKGSKEWKTCSRMFPYAKQISRYKTNAVHTDHTVASQRANLRINIARSNDRRRGPNIKPPDSNNSRAARAKQREFRRDIALLGKSSLSMTTQLFGCEQSLRFGKSGVHGWGVFTDTNINSGDLIVEYRGVLIGNAVADKREKEYEIAKTDDYMFRIDKQVVCDATHHGNVARFINASCTPNCNPRIITICGVKRIAIYAKRDIKAGEELNYDYKFQPEFDESKRIPCNCGTPLCRGFMNWDKRYVAIPGGKLPNLELFGSRRVRGFRY